MVRSQPSQAIEVNQNPHHLRNADGRMGVVELNGHLVRQFVPGFVMFLVAIEDVLQRGADEEILLLQAQLLAHFGGVVGVEHFRQVFRGVLVGNSLDVVALIEVAQIEIARRHGRP